MITDWLSPTNFPARQKDIFEQGQDGTVQWFLESAEFEKWLRGVDKTLFCPGIPGAGKTMMAAVAVDHLRTLSQTNIGIACVFCNYKAKFEHTLNSLLAALLKQLVKPRRDVAAPVEDFYKQFEREGTRPSSKDILRALSLVCSNYETVFIIIDALDECQGDDGCTELVKRLQQLQTHMDIRTLFTSRSIPAIMKQFEGVTQLEVRASKEDVLRYVDGQLPRLPKCIQKDKTLQSEVVAEIVEAADGM